ncbi:MAG TPA: alanine racemase [Terracidiphilus sp.]|jgi:alanine racemase|nr:alanine racemase [Terracidiphilus sp.]
MQMRPCWVELSIRSLKANFIFLSSLAPSDTEILSILKSDAYGHSLEICAPAVVRAGARWIAVTSAEEGIAARALCPDVRVMVIGGVLPGQGPAIVQHALTAVVWELSQLDDLEAAARAAGMRPASLPVHLEIDTGMSRQGASLDGFPPLLARFALDSPLKLEGVMTHLFAVDEIGSPITQDQLARLQQALALVEAAGLYPDWLNVGNSATLLSSLSSDLTALAARHGMKVMLRPGLALYGIAPRFYPENDPQEPAALASARAQLQPVLTWKTRVISLRNIPAGALVGYNGTFVASEPMRLALLTAGYADGIFRSLGNRFSFLVRGQRAPLVGRISMDHAVIDVTEIPGVEPGDEVVILGTQGSETVSAYDHADVAGTIPWEVFTRIAARVRRIAV